MKVSLSVCGHGQLLELIHLRSSKSSVKCSLEEPLSSGDTLSGKQPEERGEFRSNGNVLEEVVSLCYLNNMLWS